MEYDKIILELLMRVKVLEEKVELLSSQDVVTPVKQAGTSEIKAYIMSLKQDAKNRGLPFLVIKANDIHKAMGLKSRMPAVCNAMKQCMNTDDIVLYETASGFSSTYTIRYILSEKDGDYLCI